MQRDLFSWALGSKSRLRSSPNASWFAQPYFHLHNRSVKNYTACLHTHPACLKPHKTIKSLFSWWFLSKRYRKRKVTAVAQPKETKTQTSDLVTPTVCTNRSKLKMEITHSPIFPLIFHTPQKPWFSRGLIQSGCIFFWKGDGIPKLSWLLAATFLRHTLHILSAPMPWVPGFLARSGRPQRILHSKSPKRAKWYFGLAVLKTNYIILHHQSFPSSFSSFSSSTQAKPRLAGLRMLTVGIPFSAETSAAATAPTGAWQKCRNVGYSGGNKRICVSMLMERILIYIYNYINYIYSSLFYDLIIQYGYGTSPLTCKDRIKSTKNLTRLLGFHPILFIINQHVGN